MDEIQRRRWLERLSMARNAVKLAEESLCEAECRVDASSDEGKATWELRVLAQELRSGLEIALGEKGKKQG